MKLLVDTSVWSLALRRRASATLSAEEKRLTAVLAEAISDGRVVMIGPIRQELLSGSKSRRSSKSCGMRSRLFATNRSTRLITKKRRGCTTCAEPKAWSAARSIF